MKAVILASGRGSNAETLFLKTQNGEIPNTEFTELISDKPDAPRWASQKNSG